MEVITKPGAMKNAMIRRICFLIIPLGAVSCAPTESQNPRITKSVGIAVKPVTRWPVLQNDAPSDYPISYTTFVKGGVGMRCKVAQHFSSEDNKHGITLEVLPTTANTDLESGLGKLIRVTPLTKMAEVSWHGDASPFFNGQIVEATIDPQGNILQILGLLAYSGGKIKVGNVWQLKVTPGDLNSDFYGGGIVTAGQLGKGDFVRQIIEGSDSKTVTISSGELEGDSLDQFMNDLEPGPIGDCVVMRNGRNHAFVYAKGPGSSDLSWLEAPAQRSDFD